MIYPIGQRVEIIDVPYSPELVGLRGTVKENDLVHFFEGSVRYSVELDDKEQVQAFAKENRLPWTYGCIFNQDQLKPISDQATVSVKKRRLLSRLFFNSKDKT